MVLALGNGNEETSYRGCCCRHSAASGMQSEMDAVLRAPDGGPVNPLSRKSRKRDAMSSIGIATKTNKYLADRMAID
jgi:hypothetical protein